MMKVRLTTLSLILILLSLNLIPAAVSESATPPRLPRSQAFEPAKCMFEMPLFSFMSPESFGFECGYVTVPEQHAKPDGPQLRLAVAILAAESANFEAAPVFIAQGGPGGSSLEIFPLLMVNNPIRADHDIVIFDQRGTLYSEPNLICKELTQLTEETIEQNLSQEESDQRAMAAYQACWERLVGEGVNLNAFNSLENAADIEAIRQALGYEQINFYGVSYGTLLGLHYMREYPASLRAVVLDAVVPAQVSFLEQTAVSADRAFREVVQLCAADAACNAAYPNLEDAIYEVEAALNDRPAVIPVTDLKRGQSYQAVVNGSLFMSALFTAVYEPSLIPTLPALIYNTRAGNYGQLATLLPLILFQPTFSTGMYQTVICAEEVNFKPEQMPVSGVRPELAELMREQNETLVEACDLWQIPKLGPEANAPVISNVPTLLLSGRFDPITPPAFAELAAKNLAQGYNFTFPNTSHGAFIGNACAITMVREFLAEPAQAPNGSCIARQPTTFEIPTPAKLFITPVMANVLQQINQGYVSRVGWLLLSLLVLLSFYLVWPAAWLIRLLFKRPSRTKQPQGLIKWGGPFLAIGASGLGLIFVGGLVLLVMLNDLSWLFVGIPKLAAPLFLAPPLWLLCAIGMVVVAVVVWLRGYWSLWRRVYYTLLTLSALAGVVILAQWGMLTVFW
jgi:pimeloyl-ACP methyl ester carboxylesterase